MASARPILWDIYEEHLDEAAFLFGQWERAMNAASYTLEEVIEGPEERLLAHLDGLVLGGKPVADRFLIPALADGDLGKVWASAWALLQAEDANHLDLVVDAVTKAEKKEARAALARAFELSHRNDLKARLLPMLDTSPPELQAVIVNVLSTRSPPPEPGKPPVSEFPLEALLETRHPELLVAALRALRWAPDPAFAHFVEKPLASPYVAIRDAAIETGMVLGMRAAWKACSKLVARNAMGTRLALALLALGGEPVDVRTIIKKLEVEAMRRDALWALGFAGTIEAADAALGLIADEELAKLAGESFSTITGVRLAGALTEIGKTDNTGPPEVEDDDDASLPVVKPEDNLPVPNAARVRAWWEKHRPKFQPEARLLYGQPATGVGLHQAIAAGPNWRRRVWLLELAMRGGPDVDAGMWARKQKTVTGEASEGLHLEVPLLALAKA